MYYITKNNVITLTRGDSLSFPVSLTQGDFPEQEIFYMGEDDVVYFGLMFPNQHFENAILKKEYSYEDEDDEGNLYITINPEDTLYLEPGIYYYEIKLIYKDNEDIKLTTVIQKTKFIIVD